jgi:hypothetical protein
MDNFDLRKYLAEGRLLKEEINSELESLKEDNQGLYITYDDDITDIRWENPERLYSKYPEGKTRRIGFSKPVNFENSATNDAIYKYISNIYGPGEMDWRDDQELEYIID